MKKLKRLLAVILAVASMLTTLISVSASAAVQDEAEDTTGEVYATGLSQGPSFYTEEKMRIARENMQKYSWAPESMASRFTLCENLTIPYLDEIYEMVGALGSKLPKSTRAATKMDPNYAKCNYCGKSADWVSDMAVLGHNWKIQCKRCKNQFPSNDFGSFYKLGLVNGMFDYETALNKHHELFGDKNVEKPSIGIYDLDSRNKQWDEICEQWYAYYGYGNPEGYLYNESFADVRESSADPVSGKAINGAVWGVDDGYGYFSNNTFAANGNTYREIDAYIPLYINDNGRKVYNCVYYGGEAYAVTGDERYGIPAAILADRFADVFPNAFVKDFYYVYGSEKDSGNVFDNYYLGTGGSHRGKMIGSIHDGGAHDNLLRGLDAVIPLLQNNNETVIAYLSAKAEEFGLENKKRTGDEIWQNIANNLLYETLDAAKHDHLTGNEGIMQSAVAHAALILNEDNGRGKEMMDFVFKAAPVKGEEGYDPNNIIGGNVNNYILTMVNRDGTGDENAVYYNFTWVSRYTLLAETVAMYSDDSMYNLYKNPKFGLMFAAGAALTLVDDYHVQIGDSGSAAISQYEDSINNVINSFGYLKDTPIAQTLAEYIYMRKAGDLSGMHYNVFTENPESAREDILSLVADDGPSAKTKMLASFGFAALRGGKKSGAANTLNDYWMSFVGNTGHGHPDMLQIGLDAYGLNFAPDLGNPEAKDAANLSRFQWTEGTLSHNTVTVNAKTQSSAAVGIPMHLDDSGDVKVVDVDASSAYNETDIYRRTLVTVNAGDVSYGVDFFRVLGGNDHIYSFHAQAVNPEDATAVDFTAVPDEVKQDASGQNIVGSYAGADIPYGPDPSNSSVAADWQYPQGFTWLKNVRRAKDLSNFAVNFKITDSQGVISDDGLNLGVTMLNDFKADEVALATGHVPDGGNANKIEDGLEYLLVRRTGEDANLDSLFTTVYEPYNNERYIAELSAVPITVRAEDAGKLGEKDVAKAVKVVRKDGNVDYIVYATNNQAVYTVTDGDVSFAFRGFVGVYSVDASGKEFRSYVLDGDIIGDPSKVNGYSAYAGTVAGFTQDLATNNTIYVQSADKINTDKLAGRWIYIDNDGVENAAYEIRSAQYTEDGLLALDIGMTTLIRGFVDTNDFTKGYVYNIAAGQNASIPLSYMTAIHTCSGGTANCTEPAMCQCGKYYGEKDPTNHIGGTELRNAAEATATQNGYTGDTYCKGCGVLLQAGTVILSHQAAADAVQAKINTIGEVTLKSEEAIKAAREAYDALTVEQKTLVTNLDVLKAAEAKLAELKSAPEKGEPTIYNFDLYSDPYFKNVLTELGEGIIDTPFNSICNCGCGKTVEEHLKAEYPNVLNWKLYDCSTSDNSHFFIHQDGYLKVNGIPVNGWFAIQMKAPDSGTYDFTVTVAGTIKEYGKYHLIPMTGDMTHEDIEKAIASGDYLLTLETTADGYTKKELLLDADEYLLVAVNGHPSKDRRFNFGPVSLTPVIYPADKAAAEAVRNQIDAIGEVTLSSEEAINAARAAYDALTDAQKDLVTNLDVLTAAEAKLSELKAAAEKEAADKAAAEAVKTLIDAIGEVTLNSEEAINAARTAYDALTADQKALVDAAKLTAAEAKLAELKAAEKAAADKAAADAVTAKIEAIGTVTLESEEDIKAARTAYDALTTDQKALVDAAKLTAAEEKLAELKAASAADKAAAESVEAKVEAIGEVTLESGEEIKAAREAYDALTEEQKALVSNLDVLTAAEEKLAELKAAAADKAAADAAAAKIEDIGEVTLESEEAIKAAREAYDALTAEQKALVSNLDTLTAAEAKLAELKAAAADAERIEAARDVVGKALAAMTVTNDTSKEAIQKVIDEALAKAGITDAEAAVTDVAVTKATTEKAGSAKITVVITSGKASESSVNTKTIAKLIPPADPENPKTGDETDLLLPFLLMIVSVMGIAVAVLCAKKLSYKGKHVK